MVYVTNLLGSQNFKCVMCDKKAVVLQKSNTPMCAECALMDIGYRPRRKETDED
jgi:hypothetical protein